MKREAEVNVQDLEKQINESEQVFKAAEEQLSKIKTRVAMVVGYNGTDFSGSQKNPGVRTVEGVVEDALYQCKLIAKCNYGDLGKISFARASRTDKRVHAL